MLWKRLFVFYKYEAVIFLLEVNFKINRSLMLLNSEAFYLKWRSFAELNSLVNELRYHSRTSQNIIKFSEPVGGVIRDVDVGAGGFGSIPRPVKSDTVSSPARHRCDVLSELYCSGAKPQRRVTRSTLRRNTASIMKIFFITKLYAFDNI